MTMIAAGRRFVWMVSLLIPFGALMIDVTAANASCAGSGSPPIRWYGTTEKNNLSVHEFGGYAEIYVPASGAADAGSGGHINNTVWVGVGGSTNIGDHWVEGGYTKGYHGDNIRTFYWARQTSQGYTDHRVANETPTLNTYEPIQIEDDTSANRWDVYFDFHLGYDPNGTSADPQATDGGYALETGLESTSGSSYSADAWSNALEYMNSAGSWVSTWPVGGHVYCDSPVTSDWVTNNVKLHYAE